MKAVTLPVKLCSGHYMISLKYSGATVPGQFVSVKYGSTTDPLIRRPFSIFDHTGGHLEIIFKESGRVTSLMKNLKDPSILDISGPYGKGFTIPKNENLILIGGGVGNAPLHYLSKVLKENGNTVKFIYAARSSDYIYCKDRFCTETSELQYVTDDGSEGCKGYASDVLVTELEKSSYSRAYVCGPTVMMKSCADILSSKKIAFEVSLENYFGCGIGICSGCSVDTVDGKKRSCVDGPVFDGYKIDWNKI